MDSHSPSARREHLHRRVEQLLPWYANGTLAEGERRAVEEHLAACAACREELAACRECARAVDELGEIAPSPHPVQLARLMARIDALEAAPEGDGRQIMAAPEGDGRQIATIADAGRRPLLGRLAALAVATPRPVRTLLAAQLAAIALLGAVLAGLGASSRLPRPAAAPATYHTLSEVPTASGAQIQIHIVFADGATAAAIREILARVGGQIVAGPSPLGTYTVEVPGGRGADPLEVVLAHLRARREVTFVAPVAGSGG